MAFVGLTRGSCSPYFALTVLDESDNGTVKSIKAGETLSIRLAGNPSTGYTWERTNTLVEVVLEPLDEGVFIPDDENLWEKEVVDTFSVMIIVR